MALSRPFAYNDTGSPISGTTQYDDLVVGNIEAPYGAGYGGVVWWGGPNEDLRYIIGNVRPGGQPVPSGVTETAYVGFWGTPLGNKTEAAFLNLANYVGSKNGQPPFANADDAVIWLNANGFYTSYSSVTPTVTPTNTPTPSVTPIIQILIDPIITENDEYISVGTDEYLMFVDPAPQPSPTPTNTETPTPTPSSIVNCETFTFSGYNATTTSNSVINDGTSGWDSSGYSLETFTGPVSVTFQTSANGNILMGGFSYNPTANLGDTYVDTSYGIYLYNSDNVEIYENGGQVAVLNVGTVVSSSDVWKVDYDGTSVKYYQNGTLLYTSTNAVTQPLHVFFPLFTPNEGAVNICVIGTLSPIPTPTPTVTETPTRTPTPTPTPSNTPYPPDTYFFYLPEGAIPLAPLNNGNLLFTTNSASEVGYNPNDAQEVVFNLTDKSGTSHPDYLDSLTYGATVTMTQGSNTAILSGDSLMWGSYVEGYISGNYLELVQPSPNPFVSGSPINLVLTVNYPSTPTPTPTNTATPTQTQTPTNTPTPSVTPEPVTGYSFNLVALPYNFPSSGNTIMNGAGGATSGTTDPNVLATGSRGIYWNSIDSNGVDRTDYFSGFTGQSINITMSQTGSTAIYSGDSQSLKTWTASTDTGFVFGAGIGVPPVGTPSGTANLIQSASTPWTLGLPVYISVVVNG